MSPPGRPLVAAALGLWWLLAPLPAQAESELLLLEVLLETESLSDATPVYAEGERVWLPLGELARLTGLHLQVDAAAGTARGFVVKEDRTFALDAKAGRATVEGESFRFDPARVRRQEDDLYVEASLLTQWLPVAIAVDRHASRMHLAPHEPLPYQLRRARELRAQALRPIMLDPELPRVEVPYKLLQPPAIDPSLTLTMRQAPDGQPRAAGKYTVLSTADLWYTTATGFVAGDDLNPIAAMRMTLGRQDPEPRLLGPLAAREFQFGDIQEPGVPLISAGRPGRGWHVSSFLPYQPSQVDSHSFRGTLPPGWEAELYQNDVLIGYQQATPGGQYAFEQVPLVVGANEFRLVFYGPQGQRREEARVLNLAQALPPAGESRYRFTGAIGDDGRPRLGYRHEWGLGRQLAANAGITSLGTGAREFAFAGVRGFHEGTFAHLDGAVTPAGGAAIEGGVQSRFGPLSGSVVHTRLRGFDSELFPSGADPLNARSQARMDVSTPLSTPLRANTGVIGTADQLTSGMLESKVGWPVGLSWRGFSLAHRLNWTPHRPVAPFTDGTVRLGVRQQRLGLRAEGTYSPTGLSALALGADGGPYFGYTGSATVSYVLANRLPQFNAALNRDMGSFTFSVTCSSHPDTGLTTGVALTSSFWPTSPGWGYTAHALPRAESGAAVGRVFLDANHSGRWEPGEQPIEGAELSAHGAAHARTGADGMARIAGLAIHQPVGVALNPATLEDPLWVPTTTAVAVVPRPGRSAVLDFPVVATGEITGTVRLLAGDRRRELGGVRLELVDAAGKVRHTTRSAYDGFYTISAVFPGTYTLRVAPDQVSHYQGPTERAVIVPPGGNFVDGADLELQPAPVAP